MDTQYDNWLDYINLYRHYPNPYFWGTLLFFLVPILIWLVCTLFIKRQKPTDKLLAFIAGSDNRLSLSRLQAFAWTLVIFGSFVAAMAIHTKIVPTNKDTAKEYKELAAAAAKTAASRKVLLDEAEKQKLAAETESLAANKIAAEKKSYADAYSAVNANSAGAVAARNEVEPLLVNAKSKTDDLAESTRNYEQHVAQSKLADQQAAAATLASSLNWVEIPTSLLLLAGIAIGSGVFSSLISAVNDEEKTACVNGIAKLSNDDFNKDARYSDTIDSQSENLLSIIGIDMGKVGKVRFGKNKIYSAYAPVLYWRSDGTEIVVEVPEEHPYNTLIVDTPNGKLPYKLTYSKTDGTLTDMKLGVGTYWYEFSDLFRDDKNPMNMDLMKFQMFGWTVVAIVVYAWLFLNDLNGNIRSLPIVPETIVLLTGLSQVGYLAGKGVSNVKPNTNPTTTTT